ncbi:MAG: hypothetical protein UHW99_02595 [Methanobrevibacter sp.]|nr:hypothetical protein [Methanobrevibacter sp.]
MSVETFVRKNIYYFKIILAITMFLSLVYFSLYLQEFLVYSPFTPFGVLICQIISSSIVALVIVYYMGKYKNFHIAISCILFVILLVGVFLAENVMASTFSYNLDGVEYCLIFFSLFISLFFSYNLYKVMANKCDSRLQVNFWSFLVFCELSFLSMFVCEVIFYELTPLSSLIDAFLIFNAFYLAFKFSIDITSRDLKRLESKKANEWNKKEEDIDMQKVKLCFMLSFFSLLVISFLFYNFYNVLQLDSKSFAGIILFGSIIITAYSYKKSLFLSILGIGIDAGIWALFAGLFSLVGYFNMNPKILFPIWFFEGLTLIIMRFVLRYRRLSGIGFH